MTEHKDLLEAAHPTLVLPIGEVEGKINRGRAAPTADPMTPEEKSLMFPKATRLTTEAAYQAMTHTSRLGDAARDLFRTAEWFVETDPQAETSGDMLRWEFNDQGGHDQWKRKLETLRDQIDATLAWLGDRRVRLTDLERRALLLAASEVTDHDDAMEAALTPEERGAVLRAVEKLTNA